MNASATFFVCYDVITYGHIGDHSYAFATTVCHFFGGGGSQDNLRPATDGEVGAFRGALNSAVDPKTERGKKCNKFLTALLKNLGRSSTTSISKLFETVAKKKGFSIDTTPRERSDHSGHTSTTADGKPPIIDINQYYLDVIDKTTNTVSSLALDVLASIVIHELIHAAGKGGNKYSHYDMASVAKKTALDLGIITPSQASLLKSPQVAMTNDPAERERVEKNNSDLFDSILDRACFD